MNRLISNGLASNLELGMDPSYLGVRTSEDRPDFRGERVVTGSVEGQYLSANVECKANQSYVIRGTLRGVPIDFRVTTGRGYMDLSTSVPHLDNRTAEAIWRVIAKTLKVTPDGYSPP